MADRRVADRYHLIRKLGEGGMGSVWLARDSSLSRLVAVKEIRFGHGMSVKDLSKTRARVMREAQAAAGLAHPNIVTIYDVIEERGDPWIVMEYVEGSSLADRIEQGQAALTEVQVAQIGLSVLDALGAVHAARIVHRDVKPANILIRKASGQVCLVDFGNATIEGHDTITKTGLIGTLGFVAPERFSGTTEPSSDLWSLGATLYQAVEGRPPFKRDSEAAVIFAVLHQDPAPLVRARLLSQVITELLAKDPRVRPGAADVKAMLERIVADHGPRPSVSRPPDDHQDPAAPHGRQETGPPVRPGGEQSSRGAGGRNGPTNGQRPEPVAERPGKGTSRPRDPSDAGRSGSPPGTLDPPSGRSPAESALRDMASFGAIVAQGPEAAAAMMRDLGPRAAAQVLDGIESEPHGTATLVGAMTDGFAAEVLGHVRSAVAVAVLLTLRPERGARLLGLIRPKPVTAVVSLLPVHEQGTVRLLGALSDRDAGRLLNDAGTAQAAALLPRLGPTRMAAILAEMNPRQAAAALDLFSADPRRAAVVVRALPIQRVGAVLDQMRPERVAAILFVEPTRATWFLGRMRPAERLRVIQHMSGPSER